MMPKKHKANSGLPKSASNYVHPSLASTARTSFKPNPGSADSRTVNDHIEHLRRTQSPRISINDLNGINASRYAPVRTRPRRIAGPPPPHSWTLTSGHVAGSTRDDLSSSGTEQRRPPAYSMEFPGIALPETRSLLHHVLVSTASALDWHIDFDHQYLSELPVEMRMQLLSYVGVCGPENGISVSGLKAIFPAQSLCESVTRLDLTGSVGRACSLKELEKAWKRKEGVNPALQPALESWEQEDLDLSSLTLVSPLWFPSLTHLSLSRPSPNSSWTDLLAFSRQLGSLTRLSLSHWPSPRLPKPDQKYLGEMNEEDDEGPYVLNMFSRNTPSLIWISFACCHWTEFLCPSSSQLHAAQQAQVGAAPTNALPPRLRGAARHGWLSRYDDGNDGMRQLKSNHGHSGPEWSSAWKKVNYVNLSQQWLPSGLETAELSSLVQSRSRPPHVPIAVTREPEAYHIIAPSSEVINGIESRRARQEWLRRERSALSLAHKIRTLRTLTGQQRCEIDYGWGKEEAVGAGYSEQCLFEAGL